MVDMGLAKGAKALWEDDLLCDYTIRVEHKEFRVHKVVLASVSAYFHAMLTGSLQESVTDHVELKGLNADAVAGLIELVYTGNERIEKEKAADILEVATYLQVPAAVKVCKKILLRTLDEKNCLQVLSTFLVCSMKEEVELVKTLLQTNWKLALEHHNLAEIPLTILQFLIGAWRGSEWELFKLVINWIAFENESRKQYENDLFSSVRFCLMSLKELAAVREMDVYVESADSWRELVDKAVVYHNLPVHHKVLDDSDQSKVRSEPSPFVYSDDSREGKKMFCSTDERCNWRTHLYEAGTTYPPFTHMTVLNNFLVAYTGADTNKWCILDPRTLKWSEIKSMPKPKSAFGLVAHERHMYVLGGYFGNKLEYDAVTDEMEVYSFETNTWSVSAPMPVGVTWSSACAFGNNIYSSGGYHVIRGRGDSATSLRLDCFNILTQKWERKAEMLKPMACHKMGMMKVNNEDVLVAFADKTLDREMYNIATDSWSKFRFKIIDIKRLYADGPNSRSIRVLDGNTIYFLKVADNLSMKWTLATSGGKRSEVNFWKVPVPSGWSPRSEDLHAVLLAVPRHVFKQSGKPFG